MDLVNTIMFKEGHLVLGDWQWYLFGTGTMVPKAENMSMQKKELLSIGSILGVGFIHH